MFPTKRSWVFTFRNMETKGEICYEKSSNDRRISHTYMAILAIRQHNFRTINHAVIMRHPDEVFKNDKLC